MDRRLAQAAIDRGRTAVCVSYGSCAEGCEGFLPDMVDVPLFTGMGLTYVQLIGVPRCLSLSSALCANMPFTLCWTVTCVGRTWH